MAMQAAVLRGRTVEADTQTAIWTAVEQALGEMDPAQTAQPVRQALQELLERARICRGRQLRAAEAAAAAQSAAEEAAAAQRQQKQQLQQLLQQQRQREQEQLALGLQQTLEAQPAQFAAGPLASGLQQPQHQEPAKPSATGQLPPGSLASGCAASGSETAPLGSGPALQLPEQALSDCVRALLAEQQAPEHLKQVLTNLNTSPAVVDSRLCGLRAVMCRCWASIRSSCMAMTGAAWPWRPRWRW